MHACRVASKVCEERLWDPGGEKGFGTQEDHTGPTGFQNLQITRGSSKREGYSSRRLTLRDDFSWKTQTLVPAKGSAEVAQHAYGVDAVTTPT